TVIVTDFGGDSSCPIWWSDPFMVLPTSGHYQRFEFPIGARPLAAEVGCDSASFVFIPFSHSLPVEVLQKIDEVLARRNGAKIEVLEGKYRFSWEQFDPPENHKAWPQW